MEENENIEGQVPGYNPESFSPDSVSSSVPSSSVPESESKSVSALETKIRSRKLSFFGFLALLTLLAMLGLTGYYHYLEFNLEGEMEDLNKEVGRLEESVEEFKQAQVQGVYLAQQAALELAKKESFWSDFFTVLKRETPSGVRILSYSGSEGGKISISATAETFDQLASMIKNLNSALEFKDVFVASVSKGTSGEGRTVLSFPISLEYQFLPAKTLPVKKSRKRVKE